MIRPLLVCLLLQWLFVFPSTNDSLITRLTAHSAYSRASEPIDPPSKNLVTNGPTNEIGQRLSSVPLDNTCGLAMKTSLTGCYSVSGLSKVTVSSEISWTNIPDGGVITVQLGDQTKTITLREVSTLTDADVRSPQVVAFEIPSNNAPYSVSASYGTGPSACVVSSSGVAPAPCYDLTCVGLGGTVFKDFNADGIHQPGETTGLPDIVVKAITSAGSTLTTATDSLGRYTLAIAPAAYPVRVEFSNIPTYAGNGTPNGLDGRTTVQFVNAPNCGIDLGILNAQEHCQTDPLIMVPCFVNGDPLSTGSESGPLDALVAFPYSKRGNEDMMSMTPLATASQVGSLWGTTYSKFNKKLYSSAVLRRHVGLGPAGLGGIYVTDMSVSNPTPTSTSLYVNITDLGINLGTIPSNADRGLQSGLLAPSFDTEAFSQIGKVGMGDMDLAEDGSMLWFTNLHDGQLYSLRIPSIGTPTRSDWAAHPLPNDALCNSGLRRIWGVKTYQGKVYVGAVCDASVSKNKSDLRAIVYAYTPGTGNPLGSGGSYQIIFDFPLTYPKGSPDRADFSIRGWFPWEDDFNNFKVVSVDNSVTYPQPVLADIQFDIDGSMVLGFNDRTGMQLGIQNYGPNPPSTTHYSNISGGDVLRAYFSNGTFVLENGGKAGPNVGSSTNNTQGPGGGEFYNDNFYYAGGLVHSENVNGALAIRPGSGEVVVSTMDPLNDQAWSGGLRFLSNTTGVFTTGDNLTSAYVIYRSTDGDGGTLGKSTGLGGVSLTCDLPNYLQIGNRVWLDNDRDGEQDPSEQGLPGVRVSLYRQGTAVASTTTDANGEYYFTYTPTPSSSPDSTMALLPNTAYQIVFGTDGQFANNVLTDAGGRYQLTVANATGVTLNDGNDSDAQVTTIGSLTAPAISITTSYSGSVNHTYDVGFFCLPTSIASVSVTVASCPASSTIANNDGRITIGGIQNGNKTFLYTTTVPPAYTATATSQTVVDGQVSYTNLPNPTGVAGTNYSIVIYNGPYCYITVPAVLPQTSCLPTLAIAITPGSCSTLTNEYTLTGTLSLSNAITDVALLTDDAFSTTLAVSTTSTSVPFSVTGLRSGSGPHQVTVVYAGQTFSQPYTAPASCTVAAIIAVNDTLVCAGQSAVLFASGCTQGTINWSAGTSPASGRSVTVATDNLASSTSPTILTYTATCTIGTSIATAVASLTVTPKPGIGTVYALCRAPNTYTIILTNFASTTASPLTYEITRGTSFETGTRITQGPLSLLNGSSSLPVSTPGTYWIRLYNQAGCYRDTTVEVSPCPCPPSRCVPLVMTKRTGRLTPP